MPLFDRILILDWSAAGSPKRGRDSIWIGADRSPARNPETRRRAWKLLGCALSRARKTGERVLVGADFAFGHPAGLAQRITGQPGALALWDHLGAAHRDDDRNRSNYRDLAAAMNRALGQPVFWGDGRKLPTPDLPRLKPAPHPDLSQRRATETASGTARPKSVFQLAGAGAVGAQSLTGIAWLNRLRRVPGIAVWPFQPCDEARVVLAEVYPSLIGQGVRAAEGFSCRDEAEVTVLAHVLRHLDDADALAPLFMPHPAITALADEGQILGFGHQPALEAAAEAVLAARPWGDQLPDQRPGGAVDRPTTSSASSNS